MSSDIDYNIVPKNFAHCFNGQCKRAGECLRYQVALATPASRYVVSVVNPVRISLANGDCPFFKSTRKQTFARGMTHLFSSVPYAKALSIKNQMQREWGRTAYYRLYRKETLFTPDKQEFVRQLFLQYGITAPLNSTSI